MIKKIRTVNRKCKCNHDCQVVILFETLDYRIETFEDNGQKYYTLRTKFSGPEWEYQSLLEAVSALKEMIE